MNICVLGGGGFVGSALVPKLIEHGHYVRVLDTFWYGKHLPKPRMGICDYITCDMRTLESVMFEDCDTLIHLACISNDPSFELSPLFSTSVNGVKTFERVLSAAREAGIRRVIYASSSSVYGIRPDGEAVHEESECNPLTEYSAMKLECERILEADSSFDWTILRPATVCGWAPRLRLDTVVNAMTASALRTGIIAVNGGAQMRANIHIDDMVSAYQAVLESPRSHSCIFNVGAQNLSLNAIAAKIHKYIPCDVITNKSVDNRSYTINSGWIERQIGFKATKTIDNAVIDLRASLWRDQHTVNLNRLKELFDAGAL